MDDPLKICQRCGAKCCRMGGADFNEEEMRRVIEEGYQDHFIRIAPGHYELSCKGGVCPFLLPDNSCRIHHIRPKLCRRWPIYTEVEEGDRKDFLIGCPLSEHLAEGHRESLQHIADRIPSEFISDSINMTQLDNASMANAAMNFDMFSKKEVRK